MALGLAIVRIVSTCMRAAERFAGVILAGGEGRRMGGRDKGLVEYRGRPLIEWAIDAVAPQVDELVISANRNLERYARYGRRVLPDMLPGHAGPLAGVLTALDALNAGWLLVVPCDTPHLPADLALRLLDAARVGHVPLAVAADPVRIHHTCFVVRSEQRDGLMDYLARNERSVMGWQAGMASVTVRFEAAGFINLNRLQDVEP